MNTHLWSEISQKVRIYAISFEQVHEIEFMDILNSYKMKTVPIKMLCSLYST